MAGDVRIQIIVKAFKELAQFLGKKIDDLGERIPEPQKYDDSRVISTLKELAQNLEDSRPTITTQSVDLRPVISAIQGLAENRPKEHKPEKIVPEIQKLLGAIKQLKLDPVIQVDSPDLSGIEKAIGGITIPPVDLSEVTAVLTQILNKKTPEIFKIDETQLRTLRGLVGTGGGAAPLLARNVTQTNLSLTATNTEYSYTFPANTLGWQIKLRDQGTLGYYSFTTGTLPLVGGGGNGSKYTTIPQNFVRGQDNVEWSGKTIYLGAESASQVAEIEVYTA